MLADMLAESDKGFSSTRVSKQLQTLARRSGLTRVLEKPLSDTTLVENIRGALATSL